MLLYIEIYRSEDKKPYDNNKRYLTVKMKASVNDWAVWAEKVGVDSRF